MDYGQGFFYGFWSLPQVEIHWNIVFQLGKLVQQLIPTMEIDSKRNSKNWKLILRVISTTGNWLQVWFPLVEINSFNYFQTLLLEIGLFLNFQNWELIQFGISNSENWFNRQIPLLGIYSNLNSQCGQGTLQIFKLRFIWILKECLETFFTIICFLSWMCSFRNL